MADEIQINISSQVENGNFKSQFRPGNLTFDQAAAGAQEYIITITSSAQLSLSSTQVTTLGWLHGRNLDGTNYFDFGPSTTGGSTGIMFGRCEAGEPFAMRLKPGVQPLAIAQSTAASGVKAHILIWND